ncbi:hypothetical protein AB0428_33195 [Streptomyces virginiae]|uniref:hypothetical protein n=1 Tax=Streptomyces virginiae TaxID=1961 RepID=UPI00344F064A
MNLPGLAHTTVPGVWPAYWWWACSRCTVTLARYDGTVTSVTYGDTGDTPITGDWNGDGRTTQGIIHS